MASNLFLLFQISLDSKRVNDERNRTTHIAFTIRGHLTSFSLVNPKSKKITIPKSSFVWVLSKECKPSPVPVMVAAQDLEHRKTEVQLRDPVPSAAGRMFCDFVVCWQQKKSVGRLAWRNQDCFKVFFGAGNTWVKRSSWWRLEASWNLTHSYPWTDLKHICSWKVLKVLFWSVERIFDSDFHGFWGMDEVDHVYNYSQLAAMWVVGDFLVHKFLHPPKR